MAVGSPDYKPPCLSSDHFWTIFSAEWRQITCCGYRRTFSNLVNSFRQPSVTKQITRAVCFNQEKSYFYPEKILVLQ